MLDLLRQIMRRIPRAGEERQFGAVPYRRTGEGIEFLLITSRRTGRWIFPKGGRIGRLPPCDVAAQEAYEEAGVRGRVASEPIGRYWGRKRRPEGETAIEVELYPLEVDEQFDDWPERDERKRRWVALPEARRLLSDPALVEFAETLAARLG